MCFLWANRFREIENKFSGVLLGHGVNIYVNSDKFSLEHLCYTNAEIKVTVVLTSILGL